MALLFGAILVAEAAGLMSISILKGTQLGRLKEQYTEVKREADEVRSIEKEVKSLEAKVSPLKSDTNFFKSLILFNDEWARTLREVARYIPDFVWVSDEMRVSSEGITMTVAFKTRDDLTFIDHKSKLLENLRRCPVIGEPEIRGGQTKLAIFERGQAGGAMGAPPGMMGGAGMGGRGTGPMMGPMGGGPEMMGPGMMGARGAPAGARFSLQLFLPFLTPINVPKREGEAPAKAAAPSDMPGMAGMTGPEAPGSPGGGPPTGGEEEEAEVGMGRRGLGGLGGGE